MQKYLMVLLLFGILLLLAWQGIFGKKIPQSELKIGAAFAVTGDAAPWGEASLNAAKLAIDKINSSGGIKGKKVSLVLEDTNSSSKGTVSAVSKLQNIDKINVIAVTWLDSYTGAESVIGDHTLLVSQDAAIEAVNGQQVHPRVFSLWYRTSSKSTVTLDRMQKQGVKRLYIMLQNDPYYATLLGYIKDEASRRGIAIVGVEMLNSGTREMRTILTKVNNSEADAVFFGSYDSGLNSEFLTQSKQLLDPRITRYGDEFIEQSFRSGDYSAELFENIIYYAPATPSGDFYQLYIKRYGKEPIFSAGTTYDTILTIAKYLEDSPTDIDAYMRNTEFDTSTYGKVRFDRLGGIVSENSAIVMRKIINGKISNLE